MAELSLKHVYKRYPNGFEAVKDFNLDVADKEGCPARWRSAR